MWFFTYVSVNSYGHVKTVSWPNHTFFLGKLDLAVNQYFLYILSLVTDNNPSWNSEGEWLKKIYHDQSSRKYGTRPVWDETEIKLMTPNQQSDTLRTALRGPVILIVYFHHWTEINVGVTTQKELDVSQCDNKSMFAF